MLECAVEPARKVSDVDGSHEAVVGLDWLMRDCTHIARVATAPRGKDLVEALVAEKPALVSEIVREIVPKERAREKAIPALIVRKPPPETSNAKGVRGCPSGVAPKPRAPRTSSTAASATSRMPIDPSSTRRGERRAARRAASSPENEPVDYMQKSTLPAEVVLNTRP
eukprot:scaffold286867_cov30-Tisochrysis_lutea.AAC.1